MSTPLSCNAPFARFTDLKRWRHWAQIADWVTGATGTSTTRITETDLAEASTEATSTAYALLIKEHLKAASGLVEAACYRGNRYDAFNLLDYSALTTEEKTAFVTILIAAGQLPSGSTDLTATQKAEQLTGGSRSLLKKIVCCLAIGTLSRFKTRTAGDEKDEGFGYEMLDALTSGKRIFGLVEAGDAGLPTAQEMAPLNTTYADDRVSMRAGRMFGDRSLPR